jgi:hypothetical protein
MANKTGIGIQNLIFSIMGWHKPTPTSYTRREAQSMQSGVTPVSDFQHAIGTKDYGQRMIEMQEMARSHLGGSVFAIYAEEATQPDLQKGSSIWFECHDAEIERDLNAMLARVETEETIYPLANALSSTGNVYRRIRQNAEEGVIGLVDVSPESVRRIWDRDSRRLLGFTWQGEQPDKPTYEDHQTIFAPWDFVHWRRIADPQTEYGIGLLDHLYDLYKKIMMSQDQAVLHRLNISPSRHILFADCGDQEFVEAMETVHAYETMLRGQMNVREGGLDYRHRPPDLSSMLIMPIRKDEATKVERMQGDNDVPDVHDLEHFKKDFFGGARVPKAYLGHGDDSGGLAQASLVSQDIRFARMVRVLRRPIINGYLHLARLHLSFKGIDPNRYQIHCRMSKISSIEEEVNSAALEKQAGLAQTVASICQSLDIPNQEIIDLVFTEYLRLPRKFIDVAKLASRVVGALGLKNDGDGGDVLGMGGMGMGGGGMDMGGPDLGGDDMGMEDEGGGSGQDMGAPEPGSPKDQINASFGGRRPKNLMERKSRRLTEQARRLAESSDHEIEPMLERCYQRITETSEKLFLRKLGDPTHLNNVQEAVNNLRPVLISQVRDLQHIRSIGKVSLTEDLEARPAHGTDREPIPIHVILEKAEADKKTTLAESLSKQFGVSLVVEKGSALSEMVAKHCLLESSMIIRSDGWDANERPALTIAKESEKPQVHESVAIVKRRRKQVTEATAPKVDKGSPLYVPPKKGRKIEPF